MAIMMEMLMKEQTPKVTQKAIWSPPRKKDLEVAVLVFAWSKSNSLDFVALVEENNESKSDEELEEVFIEEFCSGQASPGPR